MKSKIFYTIYKIPTKVRLLLGLLIVSIFSFTLTSLLFSIPAVNILEWRLSDFWANKIHGKTVSENVAVIGVDEKLLDEYGWPLEKDIYGDLVDYLTEMGAKVIAFDIVFADNLESCGKSDSIFREMVAITHNIVLSYGAILENSEQAKIAGRSIPIPQHLAVGKGSIQGLTVKGAILPYPELLEKTKHLGFINKARPFIDGIDRRMSLFISQDTLLFPSLSLIASSLLLKEEKPVFNRENRSVTVGTKTVPVDRECHVYVNFSNVIPRYDFSDVRASHRAWLLGEEPPIGKKELEGRIIFIGNTGISLGDFGITPLSGKEQGAHAPNVMMHARAASTILSNNGIKYYGRTGAWIFSLAVVLVVAILFYFLNPYLAFGLSVFSFCICYYLTQQLYFNCHLIPIAEGTSTGFLLTVLCSLVVYFEKELDHKFLLTTFKQYLSPAVIEIMHKKKVKPELGGEEVYATAFFSDIEGFTRFSEYLSPTKTVKILNEYYSIMTRILLEHKGTLDKFIGDAIVAFFGAPHKYNSHAHKACLAAVRMQEALAGLRERWQQEGMLPKNVKELKMRIGINTGKFVTGNIGCEMRMNYTMIGDTVNIASRLEDTAKEYSVYTLVGEKTSKELKDNDFHLRKLDKIRLKGRAKSIFLYQLMGTPREHDEATISLINVYEQALETYFRGDFTEAGDLFKKSLTLERFPKLKNPSSVMMERCRHLARITHGKWDGVFEMKMK